ncbi:MAG: acetyl-CoA acetyltransferase [bacterium]
MDLERTPVIVGFGQVTQRPSTLEEIRHPVELMIRAARAAGADSGAAGLLARVDTIAVVNVVSWKYTDPAGRVAEGIGAQPARKWYTGIGGCNPQWLVTELAGKIAEGSVGAALICGAEAFCSQTLARELSGAVPWQPEPECPDKVGETRRAFSEAEQKYDWYRPAYVYAMFENAFRHRRRQTLEEEAREIGEVCSAMSRVAADNPFAWFREPRTPEQITTVSPANRMVAFPFTKHMCAMIHVDQGAAVILTNVATARRWRVPEEKWVFPVGGADACDIWHFTCRESFHSSPGAKAAADIALHQAGMALDEVDFLELYSCFPSAPRIVRAALGMREHDPRPLTVTGGLPYFGGPGNNYVLHAICRMAEVLRAHPGKAGLVHGLSWYFHKNAFGVYRSVPAAGGWRPVDPEPFFREIRSLRPPAVLERAEGEGTIETYTAIYEGDEPVHGFVIARTEGGARFAARVEDDPATLREMVSREVIGDKGKVRHDSNRGINVFRLGASRA